MRALHSRTLLALCIAGLYASSAHAADYLWNSGAFSGANVPSPLVVADTLKIDTTNGKTFDADFVNQSVVTWLGGTITVSGATVTNAAEYVAQGNLILSGMDRVVSGFVNDGTFRKNDGNEALLFIGNLTLLNNGTLDAQLGRIHYNARGGQTFNAGTVFAGAGTHRVLQNATFNGAFVSNDRVELAESTAVYSGGDASFIGVVSLHSGSLSGDWTVSAGGTLAFASDQSKTLKTATVRNGGLVTHNVGVLLLNDATLINDGIYEFATDTTIAPTPTSSGTFENRGTVRKSGGSNASIFLNNMTLVSSGTFEAQTGRIDFSATGGQFFNHGTQFTGAGRHRILQNATFEGQFASNGQVEFAAGSAVHTGQNASFSGTVLFNAGALTGAWTIPADGTLTLQTAGAKTLNSATLVNEGRVIREAGVLNIDDAVITNKGEFEIRGNEAVSRSAGTTSGKIVNEGLLRKSGVGTATVSNIEVSNAPGGIISVESGMLSVVGFAANEGTIRTVSGSTFVSASLTNNGVLAGTGTIDAPSVINAGRIEPGASAGTLAFAGDYDAGDGILVIEIGIVGEDLVSDKLLVSGTARLGGTVEVRPLDGYMPAVGQAFEILAASAIDGTFGSLQHPFGSGVVLDFDYASDRVHLQVTAVPEAESWVLMLTGLGLLAWAGRRRRHEPGAAA